MLLSNSLAAAQSGELIRVAQQLERGEPEERVRAVATLASVGTEAAAVLPALVAALGDPVEEVRLGSLAALANVGSQAVPSLLEVLQREPVTEVERIRLREAGVALSLRQLEATGPLARALRRSNGQAGEGLLRAAGRMGSGGRQMVPSLVLHVEIAPKKSRLLAIRSLASLSSHAEGALPVLVDALRSEDAETRLAAAEALAEIGVPSDSALTGLADLLRHSTRRVDRQRAAKALETLASRPAPRQTIREIGLVLSVHRVLFAFLLIVSALWAFLVSARSRSRKWRFLRRFLSQAVLPFAAFFFVGYYLGSVDWIVAVLSPEAIRLAGLGGSILIIGWSALLASADGILMGRSQAGQGDESRRIQRSENRGA